LAENWLTMCSNTRLLETNNIYLLVTMKTRYRLLLLAACLKASLLGSAAAQDGFSFSYDTISFFEKPTAFEIGIGTLNTNLLIDQSILYRDSTTDYSAATQFLSLFNFGTQLANGWQFNTQYLANYVGFDDDDYHDNLALSIADYWGVLAIGQVTGSVFEQTRRQRGAGNANLAFDQFVGGLKDEGIFYSVRFNSYEFATTIDKEGGFELGANSERPIGASSYFGAVRFRKGETITGGEIQDTLGGAAVFAYTYASLTVDTQLGIERIDSINSDEIEHIFSSLGLSYKTGPLTISAEAGLAKLDGQKRYSAAFGSRWDLARGLSLNLGVNYQNVEDSTEETIAKGSLRYEF